MSESTTMSPPISGRGLIYVFAWLLLGLAAMGYLAAMTAAPDSSLSWLTRRTLSDPQDNKGQRATAALPNGAANPEANALRGQVAEREAAIKRLELRVSGLEQDLADARQRVGSDATDATVMAEAAGSATAETAATAGSGMTGAGSMGAGSTGPGTPGTVRIVNAQPIGIDGAPLATAPVTPAAVVAFVEPPLPGRRPDVPALRQSVGPAPDAVVTGSISKPTAVTFGAPVVTRTEQAGGVGIRLTTGPSIDALRLSWSLITDRYSAEVGALQPRYIAGGSSSEPFTLIAGPVSDAAAANTLCADLLGKGIPCSVSTFTGNAL